MALTNYPTITFDTVGGSDANSGSGGSVVNGTAASVTNTSTSVSITDAVALGGVATDGSAVLYVVTASGRRHSRISAISGSSGAWTVTVQDSVWTSGSGLTWSIGGSKSTLDSAASRALAADVCPGWTIAITDGQTQTLTSVWTINNLSNSASADVVIKGTGTGTAPVIVQSANTTNLNINNNGGASFKLQHLTFTCSNATKTSSIGIAEGNGAAVTLIDVTLGDTSGTNKLGTGYSITAGMLVLISSTIANCTAAGISQTTGTTVIDIDDVEIYGCGTSGIVISSGAATLDMEDFIIYGCTSSGISFTSASLSQRVSIKDGTIDGNGSHGIDLGSGTGYQRLVILGNNITGNGGYGVNTTASGGLDVLKDLIDYNTFGSGSATDGPANTSGAYNGITAGSHDQVGVSPGYTNRASHNFQPASAGGAVGKGFPASTKAIGQGSGSTNTAKDSGASQHASAGGSAGILVTGGMTGGMRG